MPTSLSGKMPYEAALMNRIKAFNSSVLIIYLHDGAELLEHHHHEGQVGYEEESDHHLWTDLVLIASQLNKLAKSLI